MADTPHEEPSREALLAEIERLRWLVEANPQVPWAADAEGNITDFSQRWLDLTGLTHEQALGGGWVAAPHPDDVPAMVEAWSRSIRTGEPYDVEHRIRVAADTQRWMRSRATARRKADGTVEGWYGLTEDIHERKLAEEDLRRTQESLGLAMQGGRMGWWKRDLLTGEVTWSRELEAIFGLAPGSFDGSRQTFLDFIHPDDRPEYLKVIARVLETGEDYAVEFRFRRADGGEGWMEGRGRAFHDASGVATTSYGIGMDITQRKAAEESLRLGGETFVALVRNSPFGVYAVDADFRLVLVSHGARRVFENVRPLIGRDFAEVLRTIWAEPFASEAIALFRRTLETGEPYHAPSTVERRQDVDAVEAYDWKIERIALPDGRLGAVCHFYDLSEHQRYEAALREGESQYRQIAEGIAPIVWTTRPDGYHDYFNQRWYDYTGMAHGGERGWEWKDYLHPEDYERTLGVWTRCLQTCEAYNIEYRFKRHDGTYRWFLGQAMPITDEAGRVVRWFGTLTDIHEQKVTERALAVANRLGKTLAEDLDPGRIVQALSDASTEAVGAEFGSFFYAEPDREPGPDGAERFGLYVLSGAPREAFASFPPVRVTPLFAPTFTGGGAVRSDDVTKDPRFSGMPQGHLPVRSYLATTVRGRDGGVLGGLLFGHSEADRFTEEHQILVESFVAQASVAYENAILYERLRGAKEELERKVLERTADLQASNEALKGFTYHVSHDLRAPLRTIASSSRIVQEDYGDALPPEAHALLDRQADAAGKLGQLIDDLLKLSRLSQAEIQRSQLDLTEIARDAAREALSSHPKTKVSVDVAEGMAARADPNLVRLALGNLVENAVKYSPEGGSVRVGRRGGAFFVSDEGIGIEPAYFEKIFKPFERLHTDATFAGTGIGLSNVRQVVERHGGRVWVESKPGEGSTFLFTLE